MARLFDDASSEYLYDSDTALVTAPPFSVSLWMYSDDAAKDQALFFTKANAQSRYFGLFAVGSAAGDPIYCTAREEGINEHAITTSGFSANTWHHIMGVWASATDRRVFIDGGSKGTNTTDVVPSGVNETWIGQLGIVAVELYFSGRLAELGVWNAAFSDAEVALLAKGFSPLFFRPEALLCYMPMIRDEDQDRFGRLVVTAFNTPSIAEHPPKIIYPAPTFISYPSAAVAADPMPMAMHQYRIRRVTA